MNSICYIIFIQNEILNDAGIQGAINAFSLLNCATLKLDHLIDAQQSANPKQKEFLIWFYKMFWVTLVTFYDFQIGSTRKLHDKKISI